MTDEPIEEDYIFSKEFREVLEPFGDMTAEQVLGSKDFMKAILKHAGVSQDEFFSEDCDTRDQ